jgi:hypothetical protein
MRGFDSRHRLQVSSLDIRMAFFVGQRDRFCGIDQPTR